MDFDAKSHYPIDLNQLPSRWAATWVGEVCASIQSGFASGEHNSDGKGVPHLRPMNIDRMGRLDVSEVKYVRPDTDPRRLAQGDVLFNNTNSPVLIGKTCPILTDVDLAFSNHMTRLRPSGGVDTRFLAHELHYLWMAGFFLHKCLKHVNQASVSTEVLRTTVPVAIPPSPEQHRIVEAIESYFTRLDDAVATLERVQRNLKRYRASVLKAAVEGRLVSTEAERARVERRDYEPASVLLERILVERRRRWESSGRGGRYQEPHGPNTNYLHDLPELPEGWCWATLDQLVTSLEGGTAVTAVSVATSRPVLRSSSVRHGHVDLDDYRFLPMDAPQKEAPFVEEGDLLFTRLSGTLEYVGNCAVVPALGRRRLEFPDRIFRGRCAHGVISIYVQLCFGEARLRRPLEKAAKSTAGHQRISLSDLRAFRLPLPPLEEQERIVTALSRSISIIEAAEIAVAHNIGRCLRLRQSILKWAFEGRLADQNPDDEPASVLLERIKAERAAATPTKKTRTPNGRPRKTA